MFKNDVTLMDWVNTPHCQNEFCAAEEVLQGAASVDRGGPPWCKPGFYVNKPNKPMD